LAIPTVGQLIPAVDFGSTWRMRSRLIEPGGKGGSAL